VKAARCETSHKFSCSLRNSIKILSEARRGLPQSHECVTFGHSRFVSHSSQLTLNQWSYHALWGTETAAVQTVNKHVTAIKGPRICGRTVRVSDSVKTPTSDRKACTCGRLKRKHGACTNNSQTSGSTDRRRYHKSVYWILMFSKENPG
jgi:hypothetical protein